MNATYKLAVPLLAALAMAACNAGGSSGVPGTTGTSTTQTQSRSHVPEWQAKGLAKPACPQVTGKATCLALIQSKSGISPDVAGWQPIDFQTRYHLPDHPRARDRSSRSSTPTTIRTLRATSRPIAANSASERRTSRSTTKKVRPATTRAETRAGALRSISTSRWSRPVCPKCTIYLVEANSNNTSDLEAAEAEA